MEEVEVLDAYEEASVEEVAYEAACGAVADVVRHMVIAGSVADGSWLPVVVPGREWWADRQVCPSCNCPIQHFPPPANSDSFAFASVCSENDYNIVHIHSI